MKDLSKRFALSAIAVPVVALLLIFAFQSYVQYILVVFIGLLSCVAIWEYEQFVKVKGGRMLLPILLLFTFLEVVAFYIAAHYERLDSLPLFLFFIAFLTLFALHFNEKEGAIVDLAVSSFGLAYIAAPMGMILSILYFPGGQDGRLWVAYLLIVTKIADIGAYFAGNLFGRRKLAPKISPGKTVEGATVGLLCALLASFVFYTLSQNGILKDFYLGKISWIALGLILGLIGPLGDLSESLLKRDANKKDSNALPGLGGVLDMVDSLLFNAPIIYFYLYFVTI